MFRLSQIGLRKRIAKDPYYRFQSLDEIAIAGTLGFTIDVNLATVDDWLRLPGFSIRQARSLVELSRMGIQLVCLEDIASAIGVSVHQLQPYEPVLTFAYYDRLSLLSPVKTKINSATIKELTAIPEITIDLAEEIIFNRQQFGRYHDLVDLSSRLNLNSNLTAQLMYYLAFA